MWISRNLRRRPFNGSGRTTPLTSAISLVL
nr:MAG TPA: hypothetical protein [Caudoviricetes sp.]